MKLDLHHGEKLREAPPRLTQFDEEPQDGPQHNVSCAQIPDEQPSPANHDIGCVHISSTGFHDLSLGLIHI